MYQRQVDRAIHNATPDALEQISTALVLHFDCAWRHIKWYAQAIIKGKCAVCGRRHLRTPHHEYNNWNGERWMHQLHCHYSYWHNFPGLFQGALFHLLHGED